MVNLFLIRNGHPMSRFHCFTRKLKYSGPTGPVYLPSLQHAYTYALFVQTGMPEKAAALANEGSVEWDAAYVERWAKSNGLDITADLLMNSQLIFEDLIMGQMDYEVTPDRDDYCQMLKFFEATSMNDPKTDIPVVCSKSYEMNFSCGLKESDVRALFNSSENPSLPGSHIWSKVIRSILNIHLKINKGIFHFNPPLKFLKEPISLGPSHPKTVLLISNSMFRYIKDIQLGTVHVLKSATFESIVNFIYAREIDFVDYHCVILQAGVVECDQGHTSEKASLKSLEGLLDKVTKVDNCPKILIFPTFPYYDAHRSTEGFSRWLAKHLNRFAPLVSVANWDTIQNPFFLDRQRVDNLFDDDCTHVNLSGNQHLWKVCTDQIPEIGLVPVDYYKTPYGKPAKRQMVSAADRCDRDVSISYGAPAAKATKVDERVVVKIRS